MLLKCYTQYISKFGKISSSHKTRKGQFSFKPKEGQCQKNVKTFVQLPSFHILVSKVMLKILQARLQQDVNWELPVVQAGFRKDRGIRDQIASNCWIIEKATEFQKKNLLLLHWLHQSLWPCGSQQTVENSSRDGDSSPPYLPPEIPVCRSRING